MIDTGTHIYLTRAELDAMNKKIAELFTDTETPWPWAGAREVFCLDDET